MAHQLPTSGYVLGLDVGGARIGAALASVIARLPQPLDVIPAGQASFDHIRTLVDAHDVSLVVVGLPRNLEGQETAQSSIIRQFAEKLKTRIEVPIVFADESLSSRRAADLSRHNKFKNVSQDSLAACFILEEFFSNIDTI